jgi:diaminopimelate decarboxylase
MIHIPKEKITAIQTPAYYYDMDVLRETLDALETYNTEKYVLHFALKSNTDPRVLGLIQSYGHGADCVSGGEIEQALQVGFPAEKIVFAGVGKSDAEIHFAVEHAIGGYHIESLEEIGVLQAIAQSHNATQKVVLRINPEIDAHTHEYITTGLSENKFGIAIGDIGEAIEQIQASPNIVCTGIHVHVGSQINQAFVFSALAKKVNSLVAQIESHGIVVTTINMGGGLAVDYIDPVNNTIPDFKTYFETLQQELIVRENQQVHFEFGRAIVAQCGMLVSKVLFTKKAGNIDVVIVDAGMNDLMRPALYGAEHYIENISSEKQTKPYTIVGPICETTDMFREKYELPETKRGDTLLIYSTGAYGQTMSSEYNLRKKAKTYYSDTI